MNGLINRSIQCFVRDTYGEDRWLSVARALGVGADGYEMLLDYPDDETDRLLALTASELGKDRQTLLEDLGTYLVSHETTRGIRRLLRFCGDTLTDFLHALYDLPSRAQLAMPGLVLPELEVREDPPGHFRIFVLTDKQGWGDVVLGLLRAMADDYGALVLMERSPGGGPIAIVEVKLLDGRFAEGRDFTLIEDLPNAPRDEAPDTPADPTIWGGDDATTPPQTAVTPARAHVTSSKRGPHHPSARERQDATGEDT